MKYEGEGLQPIRPANIDGLPSMEPQMRSFAATLFAPVFALASIGVMALVPSPSDIAMAFKPVGTDLTNVAGGVRDGRETLQSIAGRIKDAAGDRITHADAADCFESLGLAGPDKLERCGRIVYQVLAEVEENPTAFAFDQGSPISRKAVVQELRLAATEVCRERWSRTGSIPKDSPACAVSLAALELPEN